MKYDDPLKTPSFAIPPTPGVPPSGMSVRLIIEVEQRTEVFPFLHRTSDAGGTVHTYNWRVGWSTAVHCSRGCSANNDMDLA